MERLVAPALFQNQKNKQQHNPHSQSLLHTGNLHTFPHHLETSPVVVLTASTPCLHPSSSESTISSSSASVVAGAGGACAASSKIVTCSEGALVRKA